MTGASDSPERIKRIYLILLLLHTLSASFIWGINTLFLLDAGLSNTQAFAANACFTAGLVLFEIPTGVIADVRGRRLSYLLGTATLILSTLLYLLMWWITAPFWGWAIASVMLGLGFTFFSGAVQAWLVDALKATGFTGQLDDVFARGEIVEGSAMLAGSVAGGYLAQVTTLGAPYMLRAAVLGISFAATWVLMKDIGFTPRRKESLAREVAGVLRGGFEFGWRNPPVRWVMLGDLFTDGVAIYAFYAMQPFLLQLYGDPHAYGIAGLAAAIVGGAQIGGGILVPRLARLVRRRTTVLLISVIVSAACLGLIGALPGFWTAVTLMTVWGLIFATVMPIRQAYVNGLIPSEHRATVLSFESLMGSAGGVVAQPALGRTADVWGYPASYAGAAIVQVLAVPCLWLARRAGAASDTFEGGEKSERPVS